MAAESANATSVSNAQIAPQQERDLWERIRAGFAMPELDTPLVAEKERFYLERRDYLDRMFSRAGRYLFHIVEEVERRGLPTELALLPFVESAMNPVALSSAQAAGLWQFIPSTGRVYNLSQNWWVDNRRDVVQSTRAALDYLQKIYAMHGNDWFLALASYNWGEGAVARAVKKNQAARKPAGYLNLKMPNETRHYIPKLIAIKHIVMRAKELGVALPELPNRPYFVTIEKTRPIDLKLAAQFAGMSTEEFVALNPAHNRPVIAASKNNEIKLPADRVDAFLDAVEKHGESNKSFATWQPYTLKEGETLAMVAQRGGVTAADVARANGLSLGSRILPGTHLLAPAGKALVDENKVESFVAPRVYEQVERPAVYHRVGKKDSLATIARRYGVSTASLLSWNTANKGLAKGSIVLVRPAATQTLLTTESGHRQVLATGSKGSAKGGARLVADGPISPAATAPAPGKRTARAASRSRASAVRAAAAKQSPKKQARKGSGRRT